MGVIVIKVKPDISLDTELMVPVKMVLGLTFLPGFMKIRVRGF
jgi:hypothetical protein